jgi:hypothetical protein
MNSPVPVLVDEVFRQGGRLWLENGRVHVVLPPRSRWLLLALKEQREAVRRECIHRWMQPGVPYEQWVRSGRVQ